ncbi:hypothetical protein [Frankia sp. R82]|uniref:hypothetical protein n=1 Tax=Frankia sp. R82 TaxID=2950553 RepID=UPI00204319DC|nr:hypothetical protein [Frankia sp. R82]MCM3884660.1 hypothetical protein [Frankia sp. R82]
MITIAGYRRSMAALARPIPPQPTSADQFGADQSGPAGGGASPFTPDGGGPHHRPDPDERTPGAPDGYGSGVADRFWSDREWSDHDWSVHDWSDRPIGDHDLHGLRDLRDHRPDDRDERDRDLPGRGRYEVDPFDVDPLDVDDTYLLSPVTGPTVLDDLYRRPRPRPEGSE